MKPLDNLQPGIYGRWMTAKDADGFVIGRWRSHAEEGYNAFYEAEILVKTKWVRRWVASMTDLLVILRYAGARQ